MPPRFARGGEAAPVPMKVMMHFYKTAILAGLFILILEDQNTVKPCLVGSDLVENLSLMEWKYATASFDLLIVDNSI